MVLSHSLSNPIFFKGQSLSKALREAINSICNMTVKWKDYSSPLWLHGRFSRELLTYWLIALGHRGWCWEKLVYCHCKKGMLVVAFSCKISSSCQTTWYTISQKATNRTKNILSPDLGCPSSWEVRCLPFNNSFSHLQNWQYWLWMILFHIAMCLNHYLQIFLLS